jgi:NTP pyrophosphatase (non-canonical NTP hydrolase)
MTDSIQETLGKIRQFVTERDWMQFHDPKSMAASITIEAAELLEHFQWRSREEAEEYIKTHKEDIAEELADVAMYLFELSDNLNIDLLEAMKRKLQKNAAKYPVEKAKGKHTKYTQL